MQMYDHYSIFFLSTSKTWWKKISTYSEKKAGSTTLNAIVILWTIIKEYVDNRRFMALGCPINELEVETAETDCDKEFSVESEERKDDSEDDLEDEYVDVVSI